MDPCPVSEKKRRNTSLDGTFKHACKAGFSSFCSNTPREGKPENICQYSMSDDLYDLHDLPNRCYRPNKQIHKYFQNTLCDKYFQNLNVNDEIISQQENRTHQCISHSSHSLQENARQLLSVSHSQYFPHHQIYIPKWEALLSIF